MKCINCGSEVPDDSAHCKVCGTIYQKKKSNHLGTIIAIGIAAFVAGAGLVYYWNQKPEQPSEFVFDGTEESAEQEAAVEAVTSVEPVIEEELTEVSALSEAELAAEVEHISDLYYSFIENAKLSYYQITLLNDGTVLHSDGSQLKAVVLKEGIAGSEYRRCYLYDNNQLAFCFYMHADGHKFYFKDGRMIRWDYSEDATEEKSVAQDAGLRPEEYTAWESALLGNSKEFAEIWGNVWQTDTHDAFNKSCINEVSATSALSEYNMTHSANRLMDEELSTAWVEGVSGTGEGEVVTIRFNDNYVIRGLKLWGGYHKSDSLYEKNARPAKVRLIFGEGLEMVYGLHDRMEMLDLVFDYPVYTDRVKVVIEEVYHGNTYEDTVISEIKIY